jgi:hypothetical protein
MVQTVNIKHYSLSISETSTSYLPKVSVKESIKYRVGAGRAHAHNVTNAKHGDQDLLRLETKGKGVIRNVGWFYLEWIVNVDDDIEDVEWCPGDEEN